MKNFKKRYGGIVSTVLFAVNLTALLYSIAYWVSEPNLTAMQLTIKFWYFIPLFTLSVFAAYYFDNDKDIYI